MNKKRSCIGLVILIATTGGVVLLGLLLGGMWISTDQSRVTVAIIQPTKPTTLISGQGMMVIAEGKARNGVQRIGFYVNDVFHSQQTVSQGTQETFQATFPWFSSQTGIQKMSVIAYDAQGHASEQAVLLVAVKAAQIPQIVHRDVDEQSAVEESGDGEPQPGDGTAVGGEGSQQGEEPANNGQNQSEDVEGNNQRLDDGQIADLLDQADDEDNFPQDLPGEPQDAPPMAYIFSNAARAGDGLDVAGSARADDDLGLDYLVVEIFANGILSETQREECFGELHCASREYSFSLSPGETRAIIVTAYDTSGQASETVKKEFQIIHSGEGDSPAFVVAEDFNPNEVQRVNDEVEQREEEISGDDFGTPRVAEYRCNYHDVTLEIPYKYVSAHGRNAYVTAFVANDGQLIAAGGAPIEQGSEGTVRLKMERTTDALLDTDQIQLDLRTVNPDKPSSPYSGETFYKETAELAAHWGTPLPDLVITNSSDTNGELRVDVVNKGCDKVDGFNLRWLPQGELEPVNEIVDATINPGETYTYANWMHPLIGTDLFPQGYKVIVDPDNDIPEIDENNNSHEVGPISFKYVHIYGIDINDTSEGDNSVPGQFYLNLSAIAAGSGIDCCHARRPRITDAYWVLSKGYHEIDGFVEPVILSPELAWNQSLIILMEVVEHDTWSPNERRYFVLVQSHDIWDENSWKRGREKDFSASSHDGRYTIYWRVVLDE